MEARDLRPANHIQRSSIAAVLVGVAALAPVAAHGSDPEERLRGRSNVAARADWPDDREGRPLDSDEFNQREQERAAQNLPVPGDAIERRPRRSPVIRRSGSAASESTSSSSESEAATPWFRSAIGSLAIVVGLMIGLYYLARRFLPAARSVDSQALQVVARATVSPKQSLALVHVGRRYVLVGVGSERIDVLTEVTDPEEVADLAIQVAGTGARRGSGFETLLGREQAVYDGKGITGGGDDDDTARKTGQGSAPVDDLLARLRSLKSA